MKQRTRHWPCRHLALAVGILLTGCDRLEVLPGDLRVSVLTTLPVKVIQQVDDVVLDVRVEGCDRLELSLVASGAWDEGDTARRLAPEVLQDGTLRLRIAPHWLADPSGDCAHDARSPARFRPRLDALCLLDGRTASAELDFEYAPAWRVAVRDVPVDALFLADGGSLYALGGGSLSKLSLEGGAELYAQALVAEARIDPVLLRNGERVLVATGCPWSLCEGITLGWSEGEMLVTSGTYLGCMLDLGTFWSRCPSRLVPKVFDLALSAQGVVHVLTDEGRNVIVSALETEPRYTHLAGHADPSHFVRLANGRIVFLTRRAGEDDRLYLHDLEAPAFPSPIALDGSGPLRAYSLAPDAGQLLVFRGEQAWLGSLEGEWQQLALEPGNAELPGVAWARGQVVLWSEDRLRGFARSPPHLAGLGFARNEYPPFRAVVASGDDLVVTTTTGLLLVDVTGHVFGGAEPLPCGLVPTSHAVVSGEGLASVGAGSNVFTFDLERH